jgi:hypothetical protein
MLHFRPESQWFRSGGIRAKQQLVRQQLDQPAAIDFVFQLSPSGALTLPIHGAKTSIPPSKSVITFSSVFHESSAVQEEELRQLAKGDAAAADSPRIESFFSLRING